MLTLLMLTLSSLVCVHSDPIVHIGNTAITGTSIGTSSQVEFFGGALLCWDMNIERSVNLSMTGIPFAHPPVGELRLTLPVLLTTFDAKNFDARDFGPGCLQIVCYFCPQRWPFYSSVLIRSYSLATASRPQGIR